MAEKKLPKGIRKNGNKYQGRIMYEGENYSVVGKTITEVKKKMTDLKYKLEHGLFIRKEKILLNEWYKTWLEEYKKNRVKLGTYISYEKYYHSVIEQRLGNKCLADIRGEHIQKLYNDLVKEGYAISSIKIVAAVLNGCFQQAMRNGLVERNPVRLAELPRQTEKKTKIAMTKENYWGFKVVRMDQYLFCNENGDPISRERVQAEIARTVKRIRAAGHEFPRISSHVFRHTFATRAIAAGMQPQV